MSSTNNDSEDDDPRVHSSGTPSSFSGHQQQQPRERYQLSKSEIRKVNDAGQTANGVRVTETRRGIFERTSRNRGFKKTARASTPVSVTSSPGTARFLRPLLPRFDDP